MTAIRLRRRPLDPREILAWARAFRQATGQWPTKASGGIAGARFESWLAVDQAFRQGLRGLPGGSSLAQFLAENEGARNIQNLPPLTETQILIWADEHHQRTGAWPRAESGVIPDSGGEKWQGVDNALRLGLRGLEGGSSLARLLAQHRGVRNRKGLQPLRQEDILAWADDHCRRMGSWPHGKSGPIIDAPGETWLAVDMALRLGRRGLPGGSSLALLLADQRGARNVWSRPNLSVEQILSWVDAFHERTGGWPHIQSGPIPDSGGETWNSVNKALRKGARGLPAGISLADLLAQQRGVRNRANLPKLTRRAILGWADAHRRRTGQWPTAGSGPILEAPQETWAAVDAALHQGSRGLRGGSSLARLLAQHRGRRHHLEQPRLSQKKILAWADAHFRRTGAWPKVTSGPVQDVPGERWDLIDNALRGGYRMLPGGTSLRKLLAKKRGVRNPSNLPPLTKEQVLGWVEQHLARWASWPTYRSGAVAAAPGETWAGLDSALRHGKRGLAGGSSLAKLLGENPHRTVTI
jgi:hypothetical protein